MAKLSKDELLDMYRTMVTIRQFEEAIWDVYRRGWMPGMAHLYMGQEGVAAGACAVLRKDDYITSTHRGHGHCIAKGADLGRMMAEVMGKRDGYCKGKGGEMHIADLGLGILGANGLVAGGVSLATGAAWAIRSRRGDQVVVCFFGDGAANQGVLYEAFNLTSLWKLPVVFLCENNQYGEYTPYRNVTAGDQIAHRAEPFGVASAVCDGQNVLEVYETVAQAVERARQGHGPTFVEAITYRYDGHHTGDLRQEYRTKEEVEEWRRGRDPIHLFRERLLQEKQATAGELERIEAEVKEAVQGAVEFGKSSPQPELEEVYDDVYA